MRVDGLTINFRAGALVAARRIVQHDGSAGAIQATGPTDPMLGVSDLGAASGAALDIRMGGIAPVDYGGAISAGDPITSDADGKAIAATAHTHTENTAGAYAQDATTGGASTVRIIGYAVVDGVDGDIGSVHIAPGQA